MKSIKLLGSKCTSCGDDNWEHLQFHHISEKNYNISELIHRGARWSLLESELKKCILLCGNCHSEFHFNERQSIDLRQVSKKLYIEYKGNQCEECGYNKCSASLTFHHLNPNKKEIQLSNINERINSLNEINKNIELELDKCQLLCCNCHLEWYRILY